MAPTTGLTNSPLTSSARLYFCFYDYDKACQQLIKAIKLCDESKMDKELTGIYMEQGALMMTYAQQRPKQQNFKEAEEALKLLSDDFEPITSDWKLRYQTNLDLLKKGTVKDIASNSRTYN